MGVLSSRAETKSTVYREVESWKLPADESALRAFGCDVAIMSDESTPADGLIAGAISRTDKPEARRLITKIFDRLLLVYQSGNLIRHPAHIRTLIQQASFATGVPLTPTDDAALFDFFNERVNPALFLHESIEWLLETDFKIHLYGVGWERHPRLARFAQPMPTDDAARRAAIGAGKIHLHAVPSGVMGPRLLEGLEAGAFFLLRYCAADVIEKIYPPLWSFCENAGITGNDELLQRAPAGIRKLLDFASNTLSMNVLLLWPNFVEVLRSSAEAGFSHSAASVFSEYPSIAFSSRDELIGMVGRFLYDEPERRRIAESMHRRVSEPTVQVSVNRRLVARSASSDQEVAA